MNIDRELSVARETAEAAASGGFDGAPGDAGPFHPNSGGLTDAPKVTPAGSPASQTLVRGLDVLEQVADGPAALTAIARGLGLSRSTVHRLATTLLERRYLSMSPRRGYALGPKLLELGCLAHDQISLVRLARPYLDALAARTGDVALLCVRDGGAAGTDAQVLVVDHASGRRRLVPSLRTGDRMDGVRSAPAQALAMQPGATDCRCEVIMDLAESEPDIACIAAPLRGADGRVVAAICVIGASAYLGGRLLTEATDAVAAAAKQASEELGWPAASRHGDSSTGARTGRPAEHELLSRGRSRPGVSGPDRRQDTARPAGGLDGNVDLMDGDRMKGRPA
jgi:DNA-binding IclR family transcriptional regulator